MEVWAVSNIGRGQSIFSTGNTRQCMSLKLLVFAIFTFILRLLTFTNTYLVPGPVTSLGVRPSTTIPGLIITWGPPSGSNYPTPVTYRLRYRERPSSGSPGGWSSTVQRTATQRQYTTPALKPGTRYEVVVWTVVSGRSGPLSTMFGITGRFGYLFTELLHRKLLCYESVFSFFCIGSGSVQAINVRLHGTQTALVVTWRPPSVITNPTGYRLRYHKTLSSTWSSTRTIGSQQTQYTITGLEEGTTYEVEVWATFRSGEGSRRRFTARTTSEIICCFTK